MPKIEYVPFGHNPSSPPDDYRVKTCKQPDKVCLQGGCGYCRYGTFKMVKSLRRWATSNGLLDDFNYGHGYGWPNYPMKRPVP